VSNGRTTISYAVHFNKTKDFFGEIVDVEEINCQAEIDIDQSKCLSNISQVYGSSLEHAWIKIDIKVTSILKDTSIQ